MKRRNLAGLLLLLCPWDVHAELIANPGFEQAGPDGLPAGWTPLIIGAEATFHTDQELQHDGRASLRIEAPEVTRSYIRCNPIPVAPGEVLRVSAWVRSRNVPADQGAIIAIAEFSPPPADGEQVRKVDTAKPSEEWQRLEGSVTVPAPATTMRLRLGLSYAKGTVWWDDVAMRTGAPVAARVELPDERLYPAMKAVPVALLNRQGQKGKVTVRLDMNKESFPAAVELTGQAIQRIELPVRIQGRGKRTLNVVVLSGDSSEPVFVSEDMPAAIPAPLTLVPFIPTHWVAEDGEPKLDGEIEVAMEQDEPCQLAVRVLDRDGQTRAEQSLKDCSPSGFTRFSLGAPGVEPGPYRVVAEVRQGDGKPLTAEQPWAIISRRAARVTLNRDGYLEQDGRAIFPLGMFNNSAKLEESAAAGFNIVHMYNAARVRPGRRPDDQRLKTVMDQAERAGMRCLLLVPMEFAFAGDWEAFTRRIWMFRNHPALLAWDEEEGIARGDMKPQALEKMRRILQKEDPHHPLMVGDSRDVIGRVTDRSRFFPVDQMDLGMWWWYPLPLKPGPAKDLEGEQAAQTLELAPPTFLTQRTTDKPIWVGVQSYKKPAKDARYPTPAEYRAQAYLSIIHGAKGLMWYGGSVHGGLFLAPEEGHWSDLKKLAGELRDLSPVLMAASDTPPTFEPAGAPISVAWKRTPGRSVLLCVNRGLEPHEVAIVVPAMKASTVRVLNEDRTLNITDGRLQDRFEPLATHIYELSGPPSTAPATQGSRVEINADGVMVINGRKMFPIGFTMPPPPDGVTPTGRNALAELKDAGAILLRTGAMGGDWNEQAMEQEQAWLDAAANHGLYCWPHLRELSSVGPGQEGKEAMLRRVVERFKDHPALAAWKNYDEAAWNKQALDDMVRGYRIIHEVDPHHPIVQTHAPRGTVESLRPYNAAADVLGMDIYPVGYPPGMHSKEANKEISMVGDFTRFLRQIGVPDKPVWMTLQICWSGVINEGKTLRFPTFAQERFMVYQAIINGARGLIFFGGHIPKGMSEEDARLGWNWTFWRRVLRPVIEEIGDRSPLAPALVAPDSPLPVRVTGASDVEFITREVGNELFLLACKREGATVQVEFSGLPEWAGEGQVLYEAPRKVQAKTGAFTDWFAPFDVHVYHFRRTSP